MAQKIVFVSLLMVSGGYFSAITHMTTRAYYTRSYFSGAAEDYSAVAAPEMISSSAGGGEWLKFLKM